MTKAAIKARERRMRIQAGEIPAPPSRVRINTVANDELVALHRVKALSRPELSGLSDTERKCAAIIERSGEYKVHRKKRSAPLTERQQEALLAGRIKMAAKRGILTGAPRPSSERVQLPLPKLVSNILTGAPDYSAGGSGVMNPFD